MDAWTRILLGVVGFGFLAWAGVVWKASSDIAGAQSVIQVKLARNSDANAMQQAQLDEHKGEAAHGMVLERLARIEERLRTITMRLDELARTHGRTRQSK